MKHIRATPNQRTPSNQQSLQAKTKHPLYHSPLIVAEALIQRHHLLADRVDRGRVQFPRHRLHSALHGFDGRQIDLGIVAGLRVLERNAFVSVYMLRFSHVSVYVVIVDQRRDPVGRDRQAIVFFRHVVGKVHLRCDGCDGLVDFEVRFRRGVLLERRLGAEVVLRLWGEYQR